MTGPALAGLLAVGLVSAYRAGRAHHEVTAAYGLVISGLCLANAWVLVAL